MAIVVAHLGTGAGFYDVADLPAVRAETPVVVPGPAVSQHGRHQPHVLRRHIPTARPGAQLALCINTLVH